MVNINYIHKDFFYCQNIENKALHFRSKLLPCCFLCMNYDDASVIFWSSVSKNLWFCLRKEAGFSEM